MISASAHHLFPSRLCSSNTPLPPPSPQLVFDAHGVYLVVASQPPSLYSFWFSWIFKLPMLSEHSFAAAIAAVGVRCSRHPSHPEFRASLPRPSPKSHSMSFRACFFSSSISVCLPPTCPCLRRPLLLASILPLPLLPFRLRFLPWRLAAAIVLVYFVVNRLVVFIISGTTDDDGRRTTNDGRRKFRSINKVSNFV